MGRLFRSFCKLLAFHRHDPRKSLHFFRRLFNTLKLLPFVPHLLAAHHLWSRRKRSLGRLTSRQHTGRVPIAVRLLAAQSLIPLVDDLQQVAQLLHREPEGQVFILEQLMACGRYSSIDEKSRNLDGCGFRVFHFPTRTGSRRPG